MDFFKSLFPPLKIPKLKKLKQWNGGSILSLQQLKNLPSRSRNVNTVASSVVRSTPEPSAIQNGAKCHSRKRSDISIISASVPTTSRGGGPGNYGLYALKCDRNAAKRGILLNLPRKMVAVMGGGNGGGGDLNLDGCSYQSEEMVHEKFSPCKRVVQPPPRRKRMKKREETAVGQNPMKEGGEKEFYCGDRLLERNRSELFRIAERGSNEHLNRRRDEPAPPPPGLVTSGRKTRSADNILALRRYYPGEGGAGDSESDDAEQVRSLKVIRMAEWQGPASMPLKYSESMESDTEEVRRRVRRVKLKKASEYSIENDSEKIEVRFQKNCCGSTESEELVIKPVPPAPPLPPAPPVPLPTRVAALRQQETKLKAKPKLPEKPPPKKPVEQFVTAKDFADNFKPLAAVLQESIKSADLKRKWINDFLSESDEEPVKKHQSSDSLSKKFALVDRFDRQLEQLEREATLIAKDSVESVNIFHNGGDFDEFDKLFQGNSRMNSVKKNVTVSEQVTFINQKQSNLNFSSSSFDSDVVRPPIPPPLPPPVMSTGAIKSTVNIQDYYDKKLQRVRYVSSPSPSRCFDEDPAPPPLQEAVNNKLVLPLSIINQRTVDKCSTTEQDEEAKEAVCSINGPKSYNQNHILCNLNNIHPTNNYIEPRTNTEYSSTNTNNYNNNSASVFIVGETFKAHLPAPTTRSSVKRYINYKFDDYGHITESDSSATGNRSSRPRRTFNINDFHDDCYNEEGVVII